MPFFSKAAAPTAATTIADLLPPDVSVCACDVSGWASARVTKNPSAALAPTSRRRARGRRAGGPCGMRPRSLVAPAWAQSCINCRAMLPLPILGQAMTGRVARRITVVDR